MSQDNININVTENIDQVNIVSSEVVEVVDLNLYATTEDVTINVTEEIIQVNVNKVTSSNVTKTSDITNDGSDGTSTYVETDELGLVAFSNDYNDLDNLPPLPEIITKTSELINDGSDGENPFITLEDLPPVGTENRHYWDAPYSYCGVAPVGSLESDAVWTVSEIEVFANGTTSTTTLTNVTWTSIIT
jgi:hypothetical protein